MPREESGMALPIFSRLPRSLACWRNHRLHRLKQGKFTTDWKRIPKFKLPVHSGDMRTPQLFNLWMKNLFESTLACHHSFFKLVVKHYLNSIMWTVEEVCSSEMAQNWVCGVLYHVMSHYSRKTGTLKIKISVRYCEFSHFNLGHQLPLPYPSCGREAGRNYVLIVTSVPFITHKSMIYIWKEVRFLSNWSQAPLPLKVRILSTQP